MEAVIENAALRVTVSSRGAELQSIFCLADGLEYLWQGDEHIWSRRAPNLFPICGSLPNNGYERNGKHYCMKKHGFAAESEFTVVSQRKDSVCFRLTESDRTFAQYPFAFSLDIAYTLAEEQLTISYIVRNTGEEDMPFSLGAHPGFRIPLTPRETFEHYYLEFPYPCQPRKLILTDDGLYTGCTVPYPLQEGRRLRLQHELFDRENSLFFCQMPNTIRLCSTASPRQILLHYPEFNYLGLWQAPGKCAPYLCIEPWQGTPSRNIKEERLESKPDMIRLPPGHTHTASFSISIYPEGTNTDRLKKNGLF